MTQDFKPEIKLFLIVAAVSVVLAVGGILLLRGEPSVRSVDSVSSIREDMVSCTFDEECTVVLYGYCCEKEASAINKKYENEYLHNPDLQKPENSPKSCLPIVCDYPDLDAYAAQCINKKCTAVLEPQENSTEGWQTYRNDEFGFEVKYPKDDQCDLITVGGNSWSFGRINLDVLDAEGFNLEEYVDDFVEKRSQEPYSWTFESRQQTEVNNKEAIALTYRAGGLNRLAEVTFVKQGENVYALGWSAGVFACNELDIFPQILSTFRFVE